MTFNSNRKRDYYSLEVHHYPAAVAANLSPIRVARFHGLGLKDEEWNPAWYSPDEITFDLPPSRNDFLIVVRMIPWMVKWEKTILPLVERNPWCMLPSVNKSHDQKLFNERGVEVGFLRVKRETMFIAEGYVRQYLRCSISESVIKRKFRAESEREAAHQYLMENENAVLEALTAVVGNDQREATEAETRKALHTFFNGWKTRPERCAV